MKKILSAMRKGIQDYKMIEEGDRIAVGVSGGKDSLTLLCALAALRKFSEVNFEVKAVTLDMGFKGTDFSGIQSLCDELGIEYIIKKSDIAEILFEVRKEKNPCSLCAKMRRGAINDLARFNGCNKVALGHHYEDVLETFFLSLFFEGRINCFSPVTYLSRTDMYVIRPMIYVAEGDIKGYARRNNIPVVHNPCPMDGKSQRSVMKDFINMKQADDKAFKKKIMHAIQTGIEQWKIEGLK